jgi:serine/threonine protein kinase
MIGQALGHYRIEAKLGEGGMGVVYRAFDTHLDRPVAIKILRADATTSPERRRRFQQEAKAASALNHPNIVHIYDIGSSGGMDYIPMEFVDGKTLARLIGKSGLALKDTLKYAIQVADALARAHAAGIVHRDLKPANIIVGEEGRVKLLDFGSGQADGDDCRCRCRFRGRHGDDHRPRRRSDRRRHDRWHGRLHVSRAGRRQEGRCAFRYLLFRLGAVRDGHRPPSV